MVIYTYFYEKNLLWKSCLYKKEINAVIDVLRNNSLTLTDGKKVKDLEEKFQKFLKKYGLMVNSGSQLTY